MNEKILVTKSAMPPYEEYIEMIKPLWESHWLTNMGQYHQQLERTLESYLGVEQLSLMVNGHMALELAIQAMRFPAGSEVITTPYTFVSTTHAIVRNNLVPVFCDIKSTDFTIDESKIRNLITDKTVAIVPVHVYGNICNVEEIEKIAKEYNLKVIYDAAHAFGETYKEKGIGCFGDASTFSFHATKVYNTIEGGAVAVHDEDMYRSLFNLKNFGIRDEETIEAVGANAKMNEFAAIMGLCNLKYVDENISIRKHKVDCYIGELNEQENITYMLFDNDDIRYNYAYFPVLFRDEKTRNAVYDKLKQNDISARKYFYPLTVDADCYADNRGACVDVARDISRRVMTLPLYPDLSENIIRKICSLIKGV